MAPARLPLECSPTAFALGALCGGVSPAGWRGRELRLPVQAPVLVLLLVPGAGAGRSGGTEND